MVARGGMQTRVTHAAETHAGASVLSTQGIRFHPSVCKPNIRLPGSLPLVSSRRDDGCHFPPKPGDESPGYVHRPLARAILAAIAAIEPGYVHRPLARTILAAIAAIERSPVLQRGFDNRKSKTASRSDVRIQPSKCHSSNSMRLGVKEHLQETPGADAGCVKFRQ